MKTENAFEVDLEHRLSNKKFGMVLKILDDPKNDVLIQSNVWNLINTVCLTLKTKQLLETGRDLEQCRRILLNLADRGNPKEVIVALMEEADSFKTHAYFCLLLDPLKATLKKVPGKRGKSLEWVLSTLNAHIQTLPLPNDLNLQGEEKLLLDSDPAVLDANYVLTHYLEFINTFVKEVSFEVVPKRRENSHVVQQRDILQKYILMLLHHPFLFHDLHVEFQSKPKSTMRILCESFMKSLSNICHNVFLLFDHANKLANAENEDDTDFVPPLAFSTLAYLIFVEDMATYFQPFVYSHCHILSKSLMYINLLLAKREYLVLFKGLHLARILLERLEDLEISYDFIELNTFTEFPKLLLNIGIFSQIGDYRSMAVKVFLAFLSKCDWKGRYHILNQVISTINHSGAEGLAISLYKTYMHTCLAGSVSETYFLGENLTSFLKRIFKLQEGVETDILKNSDKIITALNFLRYLLLRDKKAENATGIWDLLDMISESFLDPLLTGIEMSRAHYKQVEKDSEDESENARETNPVSANNEMLPYYNQRIQREMFQNAALTFDMIESLLFRVKELF